MFIRVIRSKRELKNLMATDGCGHKALRVGEKHHVAWRFPTLAATGSNDDMIPVDCCYLPVAVDSDDYADENSAMDESVSLDGSDSVEQENKWNDLVRETNNEFCQAIDDDNEENPVVVMQNVQELTLAPEGELPIIDITELDDINEVLDDKDEEEIFTARHTYFNLDQNSMKIILYPDLKDKLETNLCCHVCAVKKHMCNIRVEQKTFKLATVFSFTCKYGHDFSIAPECIDKKRLILLTISRLTFASFSQCRFSAKDYAQCQHFWVFSESVSLKAITRFGKNSRQGG